MPITQAAVTAMQIAHARPWTISLHSFWHKVFLTSLWFTSANSSCNVTIQKKKKDRSFNKGQLNKGIQNREKCIIRSLHSPWTSWRTWKWRGSSHFELSADILRHDIDGCFLDDLKVPGAEHFHCQNIVRFVDAEALAKWFGHAVGKSYKALDGE